jgi:N-methylhydantoinase B/oxoprolinase/acetone carboxylase alpha subunit
MAAQRIKSAARKQRNKRESDPVITEIVRNGVIAVTEEMKTNLMRTAYNIIIYEALDFTTGLFTPQGETISIGIGLPMFIRGMAETVKAKIKHSASAISVRATSTSPTIPISPAAISTTSR